MENSGFLAFDLGASSGRAIFGSFAQEKLELKEIHRFSIQMTRKNNHWHWDIHRFLEEIKKGLHACVGEYKCHPSSMAINTWGVDFGLLSSAGKLLELPFAYRDPRTDGMMEKFFGLIPKERIYKATGIQFMPINSLFQLYSMIYHKSPLLNQAKDLLFIPDILNYFLSDAKCTEFSFATTSQLYNPIKKNWENALFAKMDIPINLMQKIVQPGTKIGRLNKRIAGEIGMDNLALYSVVSHDTGSAVAAAPGKGRHWAYISSGTWSLLGVETKNPIITDSTLKLNFTNEGGINSTFRVQKNMTGLWILQQLKKSEKSLQNLSFAEIVKKSLAAPQFRAFIDPDNDSFMNPAHMGKAMVEYCQRTGQKIPQDAITLVRISLESLALKYRYYLEQLNHIYTHGIRQIHIIGGGSKNQILNQFTANATGIKVYAGPGEATSIGNIMVQAISNGRVKSIERAREIITNSFPIKEFEPRDVTKWNKAFNKFKEIIHID